MTVKTINRAVVLVFDSLGIGALPDAADYGDVGSDTLGNVIKAAGSLDVPNLAGLGLGLIEGVKGVVQPAEPTGSWGRMCEASCGKDTAAGHWEIAGVVLETPFPTYPDGFPAEIMDKFSELTGYGWLWSKPASGTDIIDRFGDEHVHTKKLIVYTSADSVFQIAAHEDLVDIEELYRVCSITRGLLDEYNIERVIARPFNGSSGSYRRTPRRRDWAVAPPGPTVLDALKKRGLPVVGIGKIGDIFAHTGLTREIHTVSDDDGVDRTIEVIEGTKEGLIFTNLVDFDTEYGHRNDAAGYARALERIDKRLGEITGLLTERDVLFITADHGCDPTMPSTDHSREYVPLLVCSRALKRGVDLGTRTTFADLGATLADIFSVSLPQSGTSFLKELL